jgi:hypothetical protein
MGIVVAIAAPLLTLASWLTLRSHRQSGPSSSLPDRRA